MKGLGACAFSWAGPRCRARRAQICVGVSQSSRLWDCRSEAGRPGWMRNHGGLNEGGSREIERKGRFSEKPPQLHPPWPCSMSRIFCFLCCVCFKARGFACSGHLIQHTPCIARYRQIMTATVHQRASAICN